MYFPVDEVTRKMHGVCDNQEELLKHYRGTKEATKVTASAAPFLAAPAPSAPAMTTPTSSAPTTGGRAEMEKKEKKTKCFRFDKGLCSKE